MKKYMEEKINFEEILEEKRNELKIFLGRIGIDPSPSEIPFEENQILNILDMGGTLEWIPGGLRIKDQIEKLGPIFSQWWKKDPEFNDEPTREGWVLWIPTILKGSLLKSRRDQFYLCQVLSRDYNFNVSFGRASELTYLISLFFSRKKYVPRNYFWIRTETPYGKDGNIILANFGSVDVLRISHCSKELAHFRLGICPIFKFSVKTGG